MFEKLHRCKITITSLREIGEFFGIFSIEGSKMRLWIEFDDCSTKTQKLCGFLESNVPLDLIVFDNEDCHYSCFQCFTREVFDRKPLFDFSVVELICQSWIEYKDTENESEQFCTKCSIEYPFSEPWFNTTTSTVFQINTDVSLEFHSEIKESFELIPIKRVTYQKAWVTLSFRKEKSLKDILGYEERLWLFLRFAMDIPIPRGKIGILAENDYERCYYHFDSPKAYSYIESYADTTVYLDMPLKLDSVVQKPQIISNWFSLCEKHYHAIKMLVRQMGKNVLLDERIARNIQVFDSLTENENGCLKKRLADKLEKYCSNSYDAENLKKIRVAFSHLYDSKFLDESLSKTEYVRLEKVSIQLIRSIINDELK